MKSEQTGLEVNVSEKRFVGAPHSRSHLKEISCESLRHKLCLLMDLRFLRKKTSAIQEQKVGGEITKHARIHKSAKDGGGGEEKKALKITC